MDSKSITVRQARRIFDALFPLGNYVVRLKCRMEKTGFPPNDPLFLAVKDADEALNRLYMMVHRLSVKSGMGEPPRPE